MKLVVPRRFASALALTALLAAGGLTVPGAVAPAHAAEATIVFAALDVLTQRHVANPDPVRLLAAAVEGLRRAVQLTAQRISARQPVAVRK